MYCQPLKKRTLQKERGRGKHCDNMRNYPILFFMYSIFFLHTNLDVSSFPPLAQCSFEAAASRNPGHKVYVLASDKGNREIDIPLHLLRYEKMIIYFTSNTYIYIFTEFTIFTFLSLILKVSCVVSLWKRGGNQER